MRRRNLFIAAAALLVAVAAAVVIVVSATSGGGWHTSASAGEVIFRTGRGQNDNAIPRSGRSSFSCFSSSARINAYLEAPTLQEA